MEVMPMISMKGPKIIEFIKYHIICWFGIPTQIITNNEKSFKKKSVSLIQRISH